MQNLISIKRNPVYSDQMIPKYLIPDLDTFVHNLSKAGKSVTQDETFLYINHIVKQEMK